MFSVCHNFEEANQEPTKANRTVYKKQPCEPQASAEVIVNDQQQSFLLQSSSKSNHKYIIGSHPLQLLLGVGRETSRLKIDG